MRWHHRQLDASVGASEPHDFAVRLNVVRLTTSKRPPHPKPNVRDDRETPLTRAGTARDMLVIWGKGQEETRGGAIVPGCRNLDDHLLDELLAYRPQGEGAGNTVKH
jgi:hypothetical protein